MLNHFKLLEADPVRFPFRRTAGGQSKPTHGRLTSEGRMKECQELALSRRPDLKVAIAAVHKNPQRSGVLGFRRVLNEILGRVSFFAELSSKFIMSGRENEFAVHSL